MFGPTPREAARDARRTRARPDAGRLPVRGAEAGAPPLARGLQASAALPLRPQCPPPLRPSALEADAPPPARVSAGPGSGRAPSSLIAPDDEVEELDEGSYGYGDMTSELELCVERIRDLRAELEFERRKAEALAD